MTLKVLDELASVPSSRGALSGSVIYATDARGELPGPSLSGFDIIPTMGFTSYATMRHTVDSGAVPAGIRALLYDNEDWPETPAAERLDPIRYYELAGELAHAHGYQLVATPGWIPGYKGMYTAGMTVRPSAASIIPAVAPYVDVIDIQAQQFRLQSVLGNYLAWVRPIAESARRANPRVVVVSGLSVTPNGGTASAQQLLTIARGTDTTVQGWWLNVPSGPHHQYQPYGMAESFLASLGPARTGGAGG